MTVSVGTHWQHKVNNTIVRVVEKTTHKNGEVECRLRVIREKSKVFPSVFVDTEEGLLQDWTKVNLWASA